MITTGLALAALVLPGVALASAGAPARAHHPAAAVPRCKGTQIEVWLGLNPDGAAAGTTFYPLEFTNDGFGTHTCYLSGRPAVFAITSAGNKLGPGISASTSGKKITLKAGQTAFSRIGIVDAGVVPGCEAATGFGLEVTPPGSSAKQPIFDFTLPVCKNKAFMHAVNVVAGVGIP
jgi:hypothetical protein